MKLSTIRRSEQSETGLWWDFERHVRCGDEPVSDRFCIRVAERNNPRHRDALARAHSRRIKEIGSEDLEERKAALRECALEAMAEALITDWANAQEDDGTPIEYSYAKALDLVRDPRNWPLVHFVEDVSGAASNYLERVEEHVLGN